MAMPVVHFLNHLHDLPTVPKVVRELLATFDRNDATIESISTLIGSDPLISAKVLRLANSPFYRRPRGVASISEAVMFIGLHAARNLVLAASVAGTVRCPRGFSREAFWTFSLRSAAAGRYFAARAGGDAETVFTIGLIHAIGEPLLQGVYSAQMGKLDSRARFGSSARAAAESELFGFNYAEVSADLAERWCFPAVMSQAIRHSVKPLAARPFSEMAGFVWLGAQVAPEPRVEELLARADVVDCCARLRLPTAQLRDLPSMVELTHGLEDLVH